jgi:hypothetical protein
VETPKLYKDEYINSNDFDVTWNIKNIKYS